MKHELGCSRRDFLTTATGLGAATLLQPVAAWSADEIDPRVAALVAKTIGIDTHNHIDVPLVAADVPGPDLDLAGEMKRAGLHGRPGERTNEAWPDQQLGFYYTVVSEMVSKASRMTRSAKSAVPTSAACSMPAWLIRVEIAADKRSSGE